MLLYTTVIDVGSYANGRTSRRSGNNFSSGDLKCSTHILGRDSIQKTKGTNLATTETVCRNHKDMLAEVGLANGAMPV